MFLVIYGHLYAPNPNNFVRVFIFQFHMPLFFFISGMLHKYNNQLQLKKYVKTIIIPTLFFSFLFFVVTGLFYHYGFWNYKAAVPKSLILGNDIVHTYLNYFNYSVKGFVLGSFMLDDACWFLIALFYCKIYIDILLKYKALLIVWGVLFVCLCLLIHKYFFVANFIMAFPFFYVGFKYKDFIKRMLNTKGIVILFPVFFIIVFATTKWNGLVSSWAVFFGYAKMPVNVCLYYIAGFSGTFMMLVVCSLLSKVNALSLFAANALISVLGLQMLFIFFVDNFIGYDLPYGKSFFVALMVYALCLAGHFVVAKYAPYLVGKNKR